jgi:hypothetical protein
MTVNQINYRKKKAGLTKERKLVTAEQKLLIIQLKQLGKSMYYISQSTGVAYSSVKHLLREKPDPVYEESELFQIGDHTCWMTGNAPDKYHKA